MGYNGSMTDRSPDWFKQSLIDLEHARNSQKEGRHEWACFAAHQAAEKAVKALHLSRKQESWGHVIAQLLDGLPESASASQELIEKGKVLDNFYIPTRYPNAHPSGAPHEHYGMIQSDQAIRYASEIIEFVRLKMA